MKKEVIIAPSLLAANFLFLDEEVIQLERNGIKYLHFDVMDGHFVPNLSFGIPILQSLKKKYNFVYDVHLMISNPEIMTHAFLEAGADIVTFHFEALPSSEAITTLIKLIHDHHKLAGMSVKPNTPIEVLAPYLPLLDLVLVMSVEPGFGGQSFMMSALDKIAWLKEKKKTNNYSYLIEVDGGVNFETGKLCTEAGAEVLVAGSYLFNKSDQEERITGLING